MGHILKFEEYLNESNQIPNNPEVQMYFDIISTNPSKYTKYIDLLKTKHNIDFYEFYNDEKYINNVDLNDIKSQDDFLSYDNYIEYAKNVFRKRGITLPKQVDKTVDIETVRNIGEEMGFKVIAKEYTGGSGNYASYGGNAVTVPPIVDVNTLIHEIGHFFDHEYSNEYEGVAKTLTYASSTYGLGGQSDEVFAENFLHYFIAPNLLKSKLPEVYKELNHKIPNKFKTLLGGLLK